MLNITGLQEQLLMLSAALGYTLPKTLILLGRLWK